MLPFSVSILATEIALMGSDLENFLEYSGSVVGYTVLVLSLQDLEIDNL